MFALVIALFYLRPLSAEPTPAALSAFHSYGRTVESTLNEQHRSSATFLPQVSPSVRQRLLRGELLIEQIKPPDDPALAGALLHHWRGTAFVPEADAQSFERLLKNLNAFPQVFAPEVLRARVFTRQEDYVQASLRVRQKARHRGCYGHDLRHYVRPARSAPWIQRLPKHVHLRGRGCGHCRRACTDLQPGTRLSVATEHLLDIRRARRAGFTCRSSRSRLPAPFRSVSVGLSAPTWRVCLGQPSSSRYAPPALHLRREHNERPRQQRECLLRTGPPPESKP